MAAKTTKTAQINLLVRDLKKAHIQEMKKPKAVPIKMERPISHRGFPSIAQTEKESPVAMVLAIWNKTAKSTKAEASSKATVGRSVSTTGPWALYCFTTIKVAAGAVAAAIAPKVRADDGRVKDMGNTEADDYGYRSHRRFEDGDPDNLFANAF